MAETILAILSVLSLAGIIFIVFRKIPVLLNLPEETSGGDPLAVKLKRQVTNFPKTEIFDYEVPLQKVLSRVRILTLKTEQKTGNWLEKLRQKSNQKKSEKDNYWEELKKAKDGK
jgi:hypothetical protein